MRLRSRFSDDGDAVLDYSLISGDVFTVDEGIPRLVIEQCDKHASTPRQDIDEDITNLFTGVTIVHISNVHTGDFELSKTVDPEPADETDSAKFIFDLELTQDIPNYISEANAAYLKTLLSGDYSYVITDGDTTVESGTLTVNERSNDSEGSGDSGESDGETTASPVYVITSVTPGGPVTAENSAFQMSVSDSGIFYTVALEHGQTLDIAGLPIYTSVTATEKEADGYTTSYVVTQNSDEVVSQELYSDDSEDIDSEQNGFDESDTSGGQTEEDDSAGLPVVLTSDDMTVGYEATARIAPSAQTVGNDNPTVEYDFNNLTAAIDFTNTEAAELALSKEVTSGEGLTPDPDTEFAFTIKLTFNQDLANANNATYPATLTRGETTYTGTVTVAPQEESAVTGTVTSGSFTYTAEGSAEGTTIELSEGIYLKDGDLLTISLPAGTTWTIAETGFAIPEAAETTDEAAQSFEDALIEDTTETLDANSGTEDSELSTASSNTVYTTSYTVDEGDSQTGTVASSGTDALDAGVQVKVTFTNAYSASPVTSAELAGSKTITGRSFEADDTFTFTVSGSYDAPEGTKLSLNPVPLPSKVDEQTGDLTIAPSGDDGNEYDLDFGTIEFPQPGTYTYTIQEANFDANAMPGVSKDATVYTVTYTVVDNGTGALEIAGWKVAKSGVNDEGTPTSETVYDSTTAEVGADTSVIDFVNTYVPASAKGEVNGTKTLTGRDSADKDVFGFELTLDSANPTDGVTVSLNAEEGSILEDADKWHANVGDLQDGVRGSFSFSNADITFTKAGTYTFTVSEVIPAEATNPNVGDGIQTYGETTDAAEKATAGWTYEGITYDSHVGSVTFTVEDEVENGRHTGRLVATATYTPDSVTNDSSSSVDFVNTYSVAPLEVQSAFSGTKTIANRDFTTDDVFEFGVVGTYSGEVTVNPVPLPSNATDGTYTVKPSSGRNVTLNFGNITFSAPGTYTYTVTETAGNIAGITYSKAQYTVAFEVVDDLDGTLSVKTTTVTRVMNDAGKKDGTSDLTSADVSFTNTYNASNVDLSLQGTKYYTNTATGSMIPENGTFRFELSPRGDNAADAPMPATGTTGEGVSRVYVSSNTGASIDLGTLPLSQANVGQTYTYTVSEIHPEGATYNEDGTWTSGVTTYDGRIYTVTVVVEQDADGAIAPAVSYSVDGESADGIVFANVYDPTDATATVSGLKILSGRDMVTGEEFTFTLTPNSDTLTTFQSGYIDYDADNTETGALEATASGGMNGQSVQFSFDSMTINRVGTYTFTLQEQTPEQDADDLVYDRHSCTVTIDVEDVNGVLTPTVTYNGSNSFTNVYYDASDAKDVFDSANTSISIDGDLVSVGDVLTYTIDWANTNYAVNDDGKPVTSTVAITDVVPDGVTVNEDSISDGGSYDAETRTITWNIRNTSYGDTGTVSFDVTVNELAAGDTLENDAKVIVGNNKYTTNTVTNPVPGKTVDYEGADEGANAGEGTVLNYTITFTNTEGDNAAAEVVDALTAGQAYNEGAIVTIGDSSTAIEPTVTGDAASGQTLTWNLTDLPDKAEIVITFSATVTRDAGLTVENSATVNGHKTNTTVVPYPADDNDKDVALVEDLTTSVDGQLVGIGSELVYTIDWAADADGTMTITDAIPTGTTYVDGSADNDGVYTNGTLTWTFDVSAGDRGTVSFHVTVSKDAATFVDGGIITNEAIIQIGENEPKTVTATVGIPTKEVSGTDNGIAQVGDVLTYTIHYANPSDEVATVTVSDTLSAGLTYVAGSATGADGGDGNIAFTNDGQQLKWVISSVPAKTSGTVTFQARVNESAITEAANNEASVWIGDDPSTVVDTNTTETEVETGDLAIIKTVVSSDDGVAIDTDRTFEFTVTLKDAADNDLTGSYVYTVTQPNGTDSTPEVVSDGTISSGGTLSLAHNQTATITGLPDGASYEVVETPAGNNYSTVASGDEGTISNDGTATAAFTNTYTPSDTDEIDPGTFAGAVTKDLAGDRDPGLQVGEFDFVAEITPADGSSIDGIDVPDGAEPIVDEEQNTTGYRLYVSNGTADGSSVSDVLFGALSFTQTGTYHVKISEVIPAEGEGAPFMEYDDHTFSYDIVVTFNPETGELEAAATNVSADDGGSAFVNTYEPGDNTKTVTAGGTDVANQFVQVGTELTYTINWVNDAVYTEGENIGQSAPATITITDAVPTGTEFVEASNGGVESNGVVMWELGEQPAGATGSVTMTVRVIEDAVNVDGTVTNHAEVTVGGHEPKQTNEVVTYVPVKTVAPSEGDENGVQVGDVLTYTIAYANNTDAEATVTVTDALPTGLTYVDGTANPGDEGIFALSEDGRTLAWTFSNVPAGSFGTVTFRACVNESAIVENAADNTASIQVGDDPSTAVNTNTTETEVETGSLAISKTIELAPNQGTEIDTDKVFTFTIQLTDTSGQALSGTYTVSGIEGVTDLSFAADEASGKLAGTATIQLKHGQTATIAGLPEGAIYTVTEQVESGYTTAVNPQTGTVAVTGSTVEFVNTYAAQPATLNGAANLIVTKVLDGRSWQKGDTFTFTLAGSGDATLQAIEDGTIVLPDPAEIMIDENTSDRRAAFGNITFYAAGTYTFTVTESGTVAGVENDPQPVRTVTVDVTDNGDGTLAVFALSITVVDDEGNAVAGDLTFTNTYAPESVTLEGDSAIQVQKTLLNRAWADGEEYSFTIVNTGKPEGVETAPMPASDTITIGALADGNANTAAFGAMTFSQAGTYTYEIRENVPQDGDAMMTYDTHVATVTVAVFENQSTGTLSAQVIYDNSTALNASDQNFTDRAAFTNTQNLETTLDLVGIKALDGRAFQEGDSFTFNVVAVDGAPLPNGLDEDGNVTITPTEDTEATIDFGTITFTQEGEYIYQITEQAGTASGMAYDTSTHVIIITVTNDGQGNLTAAITTGADQLTWTNTWTFQPGEPFSLTGTKVMTGKELTEGQFTFHVEAIDGAPMGSSLPAPWSETVTQDGDNSWSAPIMLLSDITYTAPGDYQYLITEVNDGQPGITYDGTQYRVTVHVAQDGTTAATVEQSVDGGENWTAAEDNAVVFTNSYATTGTATLDGSVNLSGTKTLTGRDWISNAADENLANDTFTFILEPGDDATAQAVEDGTVVMPDQTMIALQGSFSNGAQVPFAFGDITFSEAGTYTFTIREQQPGEDGFVGNTGGMVYNNHVRTVVVNVADNGQGALAATVVTVSDDPEVPVTQGDTNWTNTYTAGSEEFGTVSGSDDLMVTKVIEGRAWQEGDTFTFTLEPGDDATRAATEGENPAVQMPETTQVTIAYNADDPEAAHTASFGDIVFTQPGTYTFKVTEQAGVLAGVAYDTAERFVTVGVVDNLDGTLSAGVVGVTPDAGLTFTNTYTTDGPAVLPGTGNLDVTKNLVGREWQEGDAFTFTLTANDDDTASAIHNGTVVLPDNAGGLTITDATDGHAASFGDISFAQVGTYSFKIAERNDGAADIAYDTHERVVTVSVTDDGQGHLVATVVADATTGDTTFTNVYTEPVDYTAHGGVKISKVLNGRPMTDGQFSFVVTTDDAATAEKFGIAEDGSTVVAAPAASAGQTVAVSLTDALAEAQGGNVVFTAADAGNTYTFTVEEAVPEGGKPAGYTYDGDTFTVEITVTHDAATGALTVTTHATSGAGYNELSTVTNTAGQPEEFKAAVTLPFVNAYTASTDTEGGVPLVLTGVKHIDNAAIADYAGRFTYTVTDAAGAVVATGSTDAEGAITFTPINYTQDDLSADFNADGTRTQTFTYTVSEVNGGQTIAGVYYDATVFTVYVTVTDNGDGTLAAAVTGYETAEGPADGIVFNNEYTGTDVAHATLEFDKVLIGRDMQAGEFSFVVEPWDRTAQGTTGNIVASATVDAAAAGAADSVTATLDYTLAMLGDSTLATFDYRISEVDNGQPNMTFAEPLYVSIEVENYGSNNLRVNAVTYYADAGMTQPIDNPTFTNVYAPQPATVAVGGTKTTNVEEGAVLPGNLTFGYQVDRVNADGSLTFVTSGTSTAAGSWNADFTIGEAGTFTYRITEMFSGTTTGDITYDGTAYYLVVETSYNAATGYYQVDRAQCYVGSVAAGNEYDVENAQQHLDFTNEFGAGMGASVTLSGSKALSGNATFADLDDFTFTLTDVTDPDNPVVLGHATNSNGTFTFPTIGYSFYIEQPADDGTAEEGEQPAEPEQPAEGTEGTEGTEDGQPANPSTGDEGTDGTVTDDPSGETGTGETGGTEPGTGESGDAGTGTGEQPTAPEGGTGSEGGQPIEPEQPSEPVQPAEPEQPADAGQAPTDESASAGSEVSAASIADLFTASEAIADDTGAEPYTVEILDQASADEGATADTDAQSEAAVLDATASDEPIVVSDAGTYYYLITEDVPSDDPNAVYDEETRTWTLDGVTYDNRSYLVTVEVATSYDAATQQVSMTASVTGIDEIDAWGNAVPRGADMGAVAFSNSYEATVPAMVQLQGTKVLVGRDLHEGETYGFVVRDAEGNPVTTGTSGAAGEDGTAAIAFTPFYVTASGTYWIEEIHAGETIDGVTYDANKVEVTVTVTDNHDGTFSAAVSYPNGAAGATFTNTYQVSDEVDVQLEGTKTLVGRAMAAGEFGFVVTEDVDGVAVPVATGQNTAAESGQAAAVAFSTITYTAIGEHDYTVYEVSGNAGGVTYDDAMFSVHVSVTDNGDGTLGTDVTYAQPVSFVNEYGTVDGTTVAVTPEATKTLTGRDMVAGEFTFVATDAATGNVVSTGTNAADGTVAFSTIGLTAQGDYEFVITEVNGRQSGVTYDDAAYRMLVTVSDDGEGGLVAEVDYPDGLPRFANSYEEPAQPSDPGTTGPGGKPNGQVPKTGDSGEGLAGAAALALGGLGAAALGGAALLRRRASRR